MTPGGSRPTYEQQQGFSGTNRFVISTTTIIYGVLKQSKEARPITIYA